MNLRNLPYLFEYNAQNLIPKTPTQSGARYKRGLRFLCLYARGHMSSGVRNKQVIPKRTRKYGIFRIACFSIAQGCKNSVVYSHCATKNLGKNIFKPSLQNRSAPNFHYRCICVARRWVASASGCAFLEFDDSCTMHDLDAQCGPSSFRIPELLSNGTALSKTGVLAFCGVVSADAIRCR